MRLAPKERIGALVGVVVVFEGRCQAVLFKKRHPRRADLCGGFGGEAVVGGVGGDMVGGKKVGEVLAGEKGGLQPQRLRSFDGRIVAGIQEEERGVIAKI